MVLRYSREHGRHIHDAHHAHALQHPLPAIGWQRHRNRQTGERAFDLVQGRFASLVVDCQELFYPCAIVVWHGKSQRRKLTRLIGQGNHLAPVETVVAANHLKVVPRMQHAARPAAHLGIKKGVKPIERRNHPPIPGTLETMHGREVTLAPKKYRGIPLGGIITIQPRLGRDERRQRNGARPHRLERLPQQPAHQSPVAILGASSRPRNITHPHDRRPIGHLVREHLQGRRQHTPLLETEGIFIAIQVAEQEVDKLLIVVKTELPQLPNAGFLLRNLHGYFTFHVLNTPHATKVSSPQDFIAI